MRVAELSRRPFVPPSSGAAASDGDEAFAETRGETGDGVRLACRLVPARTWAGYHRQDRVRNVLKDVSKN